MTLILKYNSICLKLDNIAQAIYRNEVQRHIVPSATRAVQTVLFEDESKSAESCRNPWWLIVEKFQFHFKELVPENHGFSLRVQYLSMEIVQTNRRNERKTYWKLCWGLTKRRWAKIRLSSSSFISTISDAVKMFRVVHSNIHVLIQAMSLKQWHRRKEGFSSAEVKRCSRVESYLPFLKSVWRTPPSLISRTLRYDLERALDGTE